MHLSESVRLKMGVNVLRYFALMHGMDVPRHMNCVNYDEGTTPLVPKATRSNVENIESSGRIPKLVV